MRAKLKIDYFKATIMYYIQIPSFFVLTGLHDETFCVFVSYHLKSRVFRIKKKKATNYVLNTAFG